MRELSKEELRIGNLITDQFGEVCTVDAVDENHVFSKEIGDIPIECCMPIPISEEWLLSFGFKKYSALTHSNGSVTPECFLHKRHYTISMQWYTETGYVEGTDTGGVMMFILNGTFVMFIRYVHELQNIYRAMFMDLKLKEDLL